jgi:hypothetical protein
MEAFVGYGDIGVWASDSERDAFLDWFMKHRCEPRDSRWEFCWSESNRQAGIRIELNNLVPRGEVLEVSARDRFSVSQKYSPEFVLLLDIIAAITRGEWTHLISSTEAIVWRSEAVVRQAKWQAEHERILNEPFLSSSFGAEGMVRFVPRALDGKAE